MLKLLIASFIACTLVAAHDILDFGAIADATTAETERANSKALYAAIMAANSTDNDDNTVTLKAGMTFSTLDV